MPGNPSRLFSHVALGGRTPQLTGSAVELVTWYLPCCEISFLDMGRPVSLTYNRGVSATELGTTERGDTMSTVTATKIQRVALLFHVSFLDGGPARHCFRVGIRMSVKCFTIPLSRVVAWESGSLQRLLDG